MSLLKTVARVILWNFYLELDAVTFITRFFKMLLLNLGIKA